MIVDIHAHYFPKAYNYHPIQNGICSPMINDYRFTVSVGASLEHNSQIVLGLPR